MVSMLPIVGANPSSWSILTDDAFKREESGSASGTVPASTSSPTLSSSSTSDPKSDSSSDTKLVLLISGEFANDLMIGKSSLAGAAHERNRP